MRSFKVLAAAAILAVGTIANVANAQQSTPQPNWPGNQGNGYNMMGPWMMGPGMMNNGTMGPGMMGQYGNMPMMGWGNQGASMCGMMSSHIDGRLAYLKTELKITSAQESLWNTYADAARDNAQAMTDRCTAMMTQSGDTPLSLPDRLDRHEIFMEGQLESIRAMNKTLRPLYGALSDSQKQAADQLISGPMGMM